MLSTNAKSTANRTSLAGIARVYLHRGDTKGRSLIGNKGLQLVESPRVKISPLAFAMPGAFPNACQIFQDNDGCIVLTGKLYHALAHHQASERLTPQLARRAVQAAAGLSYPATVWDSENKYGYRVYAKSARKITEDE